MSSQVERLIELGVPGMAGITDRRLRDLAAALPAVEGQGRVVLAVHPSLLPTARLATLMKRGEKAGFVVVDMTDLAEFHPADDLDVPDTPLYLVGT